MNKTKNQNNKTPEEGSSPVRECLKDDSLRDWKRIQETLEQFKPKEKEKQQILHDKWRHFS